MTTEPSVGPTADARVGRITVAWLLSGGAVAAQMLQQYGSFSVTVALVATAAMAALVIVAMSAEAEGVRRGVRIALGVALFWMAWQGGVGQDGLIWLTVAAAVSVAIAAEVLDGPTGDRLAARWLTACAAGLLGTAAVAGTMSWLLVRNVTIVTLIATTEAALATGAADLGPGRRRAGRASVIVLPVLLGAVLLATRVGLREPAILIAISSIGVGAMVLVPGRWQEVERAAAPIVRPVDRALSAFDRVGARVIAPFAVAAGWSWRWVRRFFAWVGHALAMVLLTGVWFVVVALPWAFQRATRWDPLAAPTTKGSRWVPLVRAADRSEHAWSPEHADPVARRPIARRRTVISILSLAVLALAWRELPLLGNDGPAPGSDQVFMSKASLDATNVEMMEHAKVRLYAGTELPNYSSPHLKVADGIRATWQPPTRRCDSRVVVWFFGGSTAFGIAQDDNRTIASELAKQAWREGTPLAIQNRAVPGDVAWQEHARLQRALATAAEPPDLVVFYDGFNDLQAQDWASGLDDGGVGTFRTLSDADLMPMLSNVTMRESRNGQTYTGRATRPQLKSNFAESVPAALFQYGTADRWSRNLLKPLGIPMVRFYQPSRPTAGRRPGDTDGVWNVALVDAIAVLRSQLPTRVVDIADSLDHLQGSFWLDTVHTTEAANPTIAAAILDELRPKLADVKRSKDPSCS